MVRADSRLRILDAAAEIVQDGGISGLTFAVLAAKAELSRAGVTFHFHTREDLLLALSQHMAMRSVELLESEIGRPLVEATAEEVLRARIRNHAHPVLRASMRLMSELDGRQHALQAWNGARAGWLSGEATDTAAVRRFIVLLATDALTALDLDQVTQLTDDQVRAVKDELLGLLASD